TPGTVNQVRGGAYYPTATLQSTANVCCSGRIYLQPYCSETVKIDDSNLPGGDWIFKLTADYWTVSGITFQNSPDSAVVCQSCASTVWDTIKTINGGDSGFTLTGDGTTNNTVRNIDSYCHYAPANHGENADRIAVNLGSGGRNLITGARLYPHSD
ncbi:pectate lyase, partial [Streptomyces sp. JV178]